MVEATTIGTPSAPAARRRTASSDKPAAGQNPKYAFIDALRGYAVLLVITCHAGAQFPELPYPLKKLTNFGWHGVQLFFLLSCVTLLLSWRSDEAKGRASAIAFWTRRLFRIAPMYYLAGLFYFWVSPPPGGFDLGQLLATVFFVNAWHPALMPTLPDRWMVVPGGWSIGVEFTFYMLFPLIAVRVRTLRAAVGLCALTLLAGCLVNPLMHQALQGRYPASHIDEFLYFWFPNQAPVFALGAVLYFILQRLRQNPTGRGAVLLQRHGAAIVLGCIATAVLAANIPFPDQLPFAPPLLVPRLLVASLIFMVAVTALASSPRSLFISRPIRSLGQVSFSAYLLHFAVLQKLPAVLPAAFDGGATGWRAIFSCFALWITTLAVTYALSAATYRWVETPMIELGRRLLAARAHPLASAKLPAASP